MPMTGRRDGSGLKALLSCGCLASGKRRPSKGSGEQPPRSASCRRAAHTDIAQLNCPERQAADMLPQLPQLPPQPREYANIAVGNFHNYMNMSDGLPLGSAAEQSDPQLNYMDMDFSTGVGRPASAAAPEIPEAAPQRQLNYAQLKPSSNHEHPSSQAKQRLQQQPAAEIAYCELDLRAMAALVATAREEDQRQQASGSLPRLRNPSQQPQQHWQRQSMEGRSRPGEKPMSLGRLKSSLSRSLSRLSLIRRHAQSTANQS